MRHLTINLVEQTAATLTVLFTKNCHGFMKIVRETADSFECCGNLRGKKPRNNVFASYRSGVRLPSSPPNFLLVKAAAYLKKLLHLPLKLTNHLDAESCAFLREILSSIVRQLSDFSKAIFGQNLNISNLGTMLKSAFARTLNIESDSIGKSFYGENTISQTRVLVRWKNQEIEGFDRSLFSLTF